MLDRLGMACGRRQDPQLLEKAFGRRDLERRRVAENVVLGGVRLAAGQPFAWHAQHLERGTARAGNIVVEDIARRRAEPEHGVIARRRREQPLRQRRWQIWKHLEPGLEVAMRLRVHSAVAVGGVGMGLARDGEHRFSQTTLCLVLVQRDGLEGGFEAKRRDGLGHSP